jgi:hypothetical protein
MSESKNEGKKAKKDSPANGKSSATDTIAQIGDVDVPIKVAVAEQPVSKKRDHGQLGDPSTELTEEEEADLFFIEQSRRRVVPVPVAVVAARASASIVPSAVLREPKRVLATLVPLLVNSITVGLSIANSAIIRSFLLGNHYSCVAVV